MKPEELARKKIDELLEAAGWKVQSVKDLNPSASLGIAIREFPLKSGFADYLLMADRKALGVIEAKPEGTTLSGTADQSDKYLFSLPPDLQCIRKPLPFAYESTGTETFFRDCRDPDCRSRRIFSFHQPGTLLEWANQPETLRERLRNLPPLITDGLRDCQIEAVTHLEKSFAGSRQRAVIQVVNNLIKNQARFIAVKQGMIINGRSDIATKVMVTMFGLFAEIERDLLSERTKMGLANAKSKGIKLARPVGKLGKDKLDGKENEIRELLGYRVSKGAIARKFGVSRTCMVDFIKKRGIKPNQ